MSATATISSHLQLLCDRRGDLFLYKSSFYGLILTVCIAGGGSSRNRNLVLLAATMVVNLSN